MTKMQTILIIILSVATNSATVLAAGEPRPAPTSTTTPAPTSTTTPDVQLECDSTGKLTLKNIPAWVNSASAGCTNDTPTVTKSTNTIVITGCKVGTPVTLYMYSTSTTPATDSLMNAGQMSTLVLTCTSAAGGVYRATVDLPGSVSPSTVTAKETISLSMSLTDKGSAQKLANVVIGKTYDLHITGAGSNFMTIINCSATGSNVVNPVTVYDSRNNRNDPGVMSSPKPDSVSRTDLDQHPLQISMTGFRLVGSSTVRLECDVKLCDHEDSCTPTRKRKRTKVNIKRAGIQFEVIGAQDRTPASGAKEMHAEWKFTLTFAIAVMTGHLMLR